LRGLTPPWVGGCEPLQRAAEAGVLARARGTASPALDTVVLADPGTTGHPDRTAVEA
jgi:hypothetical protein